MISMSNILLHVSLFDIYHNTDLPTSSQPRHSQLVRGVIRRGVGPPLHQICRQNLAAVGKNGKGSKKKRGGEEERREEKKREGERKKERKGGKERRKKGGKKEERQEDKEKGRAVVGLIYYHHPSPSTIVCVGTFQIKHNNPISCSSLLCQHFYQY